MKVSLEGAFKVSQGLRKLFYFKSSVVFTELS
jgi:hypothetical protein